MIALRGVTKSFRDGPREVPVVEAAAIEAALAGIPAIAAGNIGQPLAEVALEGMSPTWVALEISSFQKQTFVLATEHSLWRDREIGTVCPMNFVASVMKMLLKQN